MRRHYYRSATGDLVFYDTLESVRLNTTGQEIYERFIEGGSAETIATALAEKYDIQTGEALADVSEMLANFEQIGLIQNERDRSDWSPHTAIVHIIQNCNSPCRMCDCWQTKGKRHHSREQLSKTWAYLAENGNQQIMVSGGEPLLHPELPGIIEDIKATGMHVLLNTNGLLLSRAEWLAHAGIAEVVVSMDGFDSNTYKEARGIDGFERVWKNIAQLRATAPDLSIGIRLVLSRINLFDLAKIFERARAEKVNRIGVSPLDIDSLSFSRTQMDMQKSESIRERFLPDANELNEFDEALDGDLGLMIAQASDEGLSDWSLDDYRRCSHFYRELLSGQPSSFSPEPCLFPQTSLVVDYDGGLKPCFYSAPIASLSNPAAYGERFSEALSDLRSGGKCKSCRGRVFCDVARD